MYDDPLDERIYDVVRLQTSSTFLHRLKMLLYLSAHIPVILF